MAESIDGAQPLLARLVEIVDARPELDNPAFGLRVLGNAMFTQTVITYPDDPERRIAVQMRDVDTLVQHSALLRTAVGDGWELRLNTHRFQK